MTQEDNTFILLTREAVNEYEDAQMEWRSHPYIEDFIDDETREIIPIERGADTLIMTTDKTHYLLKIYPNESGCGLTVYGVFPVKIPKEKELGIYKLANHLNFYNYFHFGGMSSSESWYFISNKDLEFELSLRPNPEDYNKEFVKYVLDYMKETMDRTFGLMMGVIYGDLQYPYVDDE